MAHGVVDLIQDAGIADAYSPQALGACHTLCRVPRPCGSGPRWGGRADFRSERNHAVVPATEGG
jgi:hypothetical protein